MYVLVKKAQLEQVAYEPSKLMKDVAANLHHEAESPLCGPQQEPPKMTHEGGEPTTQIW
jgi:hypothetical protein